MSEQSEQIHFETALDDAGNRVMKATTEGHTTNLSTWSDLAQFLNVSMEIKQPEKQETIWVMESDICEQCGGLIGDFGICLDCGDDGVDWDEEEWDDDQEEITAKQRVYNLFLQKLEAKYPGHPWTRKQEQ